MSFFVSVEPFTDLNEVEPGDRISFLGEYSPSWYEVQRIGRDGVYGVFRSIYSEIGSGRPKLIARFNEPLPNRYPVKVTLHDS